MDLFSIFMPTIAAQLISRGFKLIRTAPNKKDPKRIVYQFENTLELQLALQDILKK